MTYLCVSGEGRGNSWRERPSAAEIPQVAPRLVLERPRLHQGLLWPPLRWSTFCLSIIRPRRVVNNNDDNNQIN